MLIGDDGFGADVNETSKAERFSKIYIFFILSIIINERKIQSDPLTLEKESRLLFCND